VLTSDLRDQLHTLGKLEDQYCSFAKDLTKDENRLKEKNVCFCLFFSFYNFLVAFIS